MPLFGSILGGQGGGSEAELPDCPSPSTLAEFEALAAKTLDSMLTMEREGECARCDVSTRGCACGVCGFWVVCEY